MPTKKSTNPKPTPKEISDWRQKAEKWDALDKEIAKYYCSEKGDDIPEIEGDLCDIGEAAASAFGWL